jgi:cell wall-associated NlpC family hydrolase
MIMKKQLLGLTFLATVVLAQQAAAQDSSTSSSNVSDTSVATSSNPSSSETSVSSTEPASSSSQIASPETAAATVRTTAQVATNAMYRVYNPNSGEHFYTANADEARNIIIIGWRYERVGWYAPQHSNTPVYRLYNPNVGDHHYTTNPSEKDLLVIKGWHYEGIGWYSDDAKQVKVYRAYNPNAKSGTHNYTTNALEQALVVKAGWRDEGLAWYGSNVVPTNNQDSELSQTFGPNQWYTINGQKKHTDQNSKWQTGFQWISGKIYYFDNNGNMQANKTVTDRGNTYQLNGDGTLTTGNATIEKAIAAGMTKVGNSPYVLGGGRTAASIAANQFDCSSFVYWMYQQAGISLGNQGSTTTYTQQYVGSAVSFASMKRGDIFMMNNTGHVGLYLGGGYFIHSSPNAKFSTVYGGQAQPNYTHSAYDYNGVYYGGVGVSRLTDVLSRDPADGNHWVTTTTWAGIQNNIVRRIVR